MKSRVHVSNKDKWVNKVELNLKKSKTQQQQRHASKRKVYYSLRLNEFSWNKEQFDILDLNMCDGWVSATTRTFEEGNQFLLKTQNSIRSNECGNLHAKDRRQTLHHCTDIKTNNGRGENSKLILNLVFDWNNYEQWKVFPREIVLQQVTTAGIVLFIFSTNSNYLTIVEYMCLILVQKF